MKWFLRLALLINLIFAALTGFGYLASYLPPEKSTFIQSIGLLMPWLLLGNILLALFWFSLRRKWLWISIVTLILGLGQITRFVGFHFNQENDPNGILVCTYNSKSYNESNRLETFLEQIHGEFKLDILCLQEISRDHLPAVKKTSNLKNSHFYRGKMILTNYPIKETGHIQFDNSVNGCVWVDLSIDEKIIRVYNTHLKSNKVTREAETIMENIKTDKAQAWTKMQHMVNSYEIASKIRIVQVMKILDHINQCPYPVVLMGDLNDTPFSYTYQQFNDRLTDIFSTNGLGFGSTYAGSLPGLKIDYIFTDENFEGLSHKIVRTRISDHFPVLSLIKMKS